MRFAFPQPPTQCWCCRVANTKGRWESVHAVWTLGLSVSVDHLLDWVCAVLLHRWIEVLMVVGLVGDVFLPNRLHHYMQRSTYICLSETRQAKRCDRCNSLLLPQNLDFRFDKSSAASDNHLCHRCAPRSTGSRQSQDSSTLEKL